MWLLNLRYLNFVTPLKSKLKENPHSTAQMQGLVLLGCVCMAIGAPTLNKGKLFRLHLYLLCIIHSFFHLCIRSLIDSFVLSFIYSFIYLFIYSKFILDSILLLKNVIHKVFINTFIYTWSCIWIP